MTVLCIWKFSPRHLTTISYINLHFTAPYSALAAGHLFAISELGELRKLRTFPGVPGGPEEQELGNGIGEGETPIKKKKQPAPIETPAKEEKGIRRVPEVPAVPKWDVTTRVSRRRPHVGIYILSCPVTDQAS